MAFESNELFSNGEENFKLRTGKDFSFYYQKYYPKLLYYTSKMCQSSNIDITKAEDITTESFLVAFEKIDKYDKEKSQFSTWLFTIAKNLTLQEIKSEQRKVSLDIEVDEEGTTMKDFLQEEGPDEHNEDLIWKKASIIMEQIQELKEPYRTVIEMREIKKMAYKDIAEELGRNLSTIKSQIRNGRSILISNTSEVFVSLEEMYK
jgi:RNA polymerase sigma factor (sigma-70 family)